MFLQIVGLSPNYMSPQTRRPFSSYSQPWESQTQCVIYCCKDIYIITSVKLYLFPKIRNLRAHYCQNINRRWTCKRPLKFLFLCLICAMNSKISGHTQIYSYIIKSHSATRWITRSLYSFQLENVELSAISLLTNKLNIKQVFQQLERRGIKGQAYWNEYCTYTGLVWLITMGSGFDDWVYCHFFTIIINFNSPLIEILPNAVWRISP
jgi:hypothetical protein